MNKNDKIKYGQKRIEVAKMHKLTIIKAYKRRLEVTDPRRLSNKIQRTLILLHT